MKFIFLTLLLATSNTYAQEWEETSREQLKKSFENFDKKMKKKNKIIKAQENEEKDMWDKAKDMMKFCSKKSEKFFSTPKYYGAFAETMNMKPGDARGKFVKKNCYENAYFFENLMEHVDTEGMTKREKMEWKISREDFSKEPLSLCLKEGREFFLHPNHKGKYKKVSKDALEKTIKFQCIKDPSIYLQGLHDFKKKKKPCRSRECQKRR